MAQSGDLSCDGAAGSAHCRYASKSSAFPNGMKKLEGSVDDLMGEKPAEKGSDSNKNQNQNQNTGSQNTQSKQKDNGSQQKNR
jgi:hypothetical protein